MGSFTVTRIILLTAAVLCLPAAADQANAADAPRFRLTVTVQYANGQPVHGAVVTVTHDRLGPEVRPYDYRMETGMDGVASTEIIADGRGEGLAYWPKLDIQAKKGSRVANDTVKVTGQRLTSGVKYPDVSRTLTIQGDEETESTKINFAVIVSGEDGKPIEYANVQISGPQGSYPGRTGADGRVSILVPFIPRASYSVEVSRRGYESKSRRVALEQSPSSSTIEAPFTLPETATPDGVVVTFNVKREGGPDPVGDAHIKVRDMSKLISDDYYRTTDSSGVAMMRLPGAGTYPITIQQDTFEPFSGEIQLRHGERERTFDFTLKEKPSEETVTVTVLAGDVKNGRGGYQPIRGASVTAAGQNGVTGGDGTVTLNVTSGIIETTQKRGYAEAVDVKVSADGYKSQTQTVQMRRSSQHPGSGAVTFTLQPGDDEAGDGTPLKVIVQVRDHAGKGVYGADVAITTASGASFGSGRTNPSGDAEFDSGKRSSEELAALRQALVVKVSGRGYKDHQSTIPGSMLGSVEPARYSVQLDRDWTEVERAIANLEERIRFWKQDAQQSSAKVQAINARARRCASVRGLAEAWLNELKAARKALDAKISKTACEEATNLKKAIEGAQKAAAEKEKELNAALQEATTVAGNCTTKAQADTITAKHKGAIRLVGEIGVEGNKALKANEKLKTFAEAMKEGSGLEAQLQQTVDKIDNELTAMREAMSESDNNFNDAVDLVKSLKSRQAELTQAFYELRASESVKEYIVAVPRVVTRRLEAMEAALGHFNNDVSYAQPPDESRRDVVRETVNKLQEYKNEAANIVSDFKSALCEALPQDAVVEEIRTRVTNASFELGLAADLPAKAQACETAVAGVSPSPTPRDIAAATPTPTASPVIAQVTPSPTAIAKVRVPDLSGYAGLNEMRAAATGVGLVPAVAATNARPSPGVTRLYADQIPKAGELADRGSTLTILVYQKTAEAATASTSPSPTATATATAIAAGNMPNLIGMTLEQASNALPKNMRIGGDELGDPPPTPDKAMTIFSQTPAPGSKVDSSKPVVVAIRRYGKAGTSEPVVEKFDGTYIGSFTGDGEGQVAFAVSGGAISISTPGRGAGTVTAAGKATFAGSGGYQGVSYTFTGNFAVSGGRASAQGTWRAKTDYGPASGSWTASRR